MCGGGVLDILVQVTDHRACTTVNRIDSNSSSNAARIPGPQRLHDGPEFRDPLQRERHSDAAAQDPAEDVGRGCAAAVAVTSAAAG